MSEDSQKNSEDIWRLKERAEKYAEKAVSEQLMRVGKVRAAGIEGLWKVHMDTFWPLFEVVTTTFPKTEERRKLYIYMTDAPQALLHGVSDYLGYLPDPCENSKRDRSTSGGSWQKLLP